MYINTDAFEIGNFGFFKDPELKLRLEEENLFDQINADGTIELWFGGADIWIPDFGIFNVHIQCQQTFFWDIYDENGERTKDGFIEIQIPINPNFQPLVGDLIPLNKDEVFDYTFESPAPTVKPLICANLWFYNNMFKDQYYRYNLLLLDQAEGNVWPNEIGVRTTPMNDNLTINQNEFIMGYRPKIEYMNQLAVLKTLTSGPDNKILFRFKLDLEFMTNNPTAKRFIRIFSQTDDEITYTLFPKSSKDIIWYNGGRDFINEYQRYLLDYGVMQYLPDDNQLDWGDKLYNEIMEKSNLIVDLDPSYMNEVASDMKLVIENPLIQLAGYSSLIREHYLEWMKENDSNETMRDIFPILKRVIYTRKYFKGFTQLADAFGFDFERPGTPEHPGYTIEPVGPTITIVQDENGVKGYTNDYIPTSALEYLNPKSGYEYSGDIGTGFYKILIANRETHVFCDMTTDGGGWMVVMSGNVVSSDYLSLFGDEFFIKTRMYSDEVMGIGWEDRTEGILGFQMYNMPFNEIRVKVSSKFNPDSNDTMSFYTSSSGEIIRMTSNGGNTIVANGQLIDSEVQSDIVNREITNVSGTGEMNSLTIITRNDKTTDNISLKYISHLMLR